MDKKIQQCSNILYFSHFFLELVFKICLYKETHTWYSDWK